MVHQKKLDHQIEIVYDDGTIEKLNGDYSVEGGIIQIQTHGKLGVDTIIIPYHSFKRITVINDENTGIII